MKDKKILKELRNGPMKNMKDEEYAMIEEEVNQKGIAGLKGYAKSMIEKAMRDMAYSMKKALEDVAKHGEHDQASHGNWAGGGAKPPTTPEAWGKEEDELSAKFEREDVTTSDAQGMAMAEMQRKYGTSWEKLFGVNKANSVKQGDMVSWNSSGGTARGKIVRIVREGKINVPDSSFEIEGTEDDPAALIQLYRDGKPTDTKVGHKVSTLKKA